MTVSALAWAGLTFAPAALANSAHFIVGVLASRLGE
jgi:hypothetical protein